MSEIHVRPGVICMSVILPFFPTTYFGSIAPATVVGARAADLTSLAVVGGGTCDTEYSKLRSDPAHSFVRWPEFAVVARSFGAQAMTIRSLADLATRDDVRAGAGPDCG